MFQDCWSTVYSSPPETSNHVPLEVVGTLVSAVGSLFCFFRCFLLFVQNVTHKRFAFG